MLQQLKLNNMKVLLYKHIQSNKNCTLNGLRAVRCGLYTSFFFYFFFIFYRPTFVLCAWLSFVLMVLLKVMLLWTN